MLHILYQFKFIQFRLREFLLITYNEKQHRMLHPPKLIYKTSQQSHW